MVEGRPAGNIIHHDCASCPTIVATSHCSEAFLACSVPDLELDSLIVNVDLLDFEVNAYYRKLSDLFIVKLQKYNEEG